MAEKVTLTRINIFDSAKSFKDNEAQITDNELNLIKCGAVVTETWDAEDGSCWYRVWSDGSIEQGGVKINDPDTIEARTITFPKEFSNTDYTLVIGFEYSWYNQAIGAQELCFKEKTTTKFQLFEGDSLNKDRFKAFHWIAKGK